MFQITCKGTAVGYSILALGHLAMTAAPFVIAWARGLSDLMRLAFELLPGMWPLLALVIVNCGMSATVWRLKAFGAIGKLLVGIAATALFALMATVAIASMWKLHLEAVPTFAEGAAFVPVALACLYGYLAAEVFVSINRSNQTLEPTP